LQTSVGFLIASDLRIAKLMEAGLSSHAFRLDGPVPDQLSSEQIAHDKKIRARCQLQKCPLRWSQQGRYRCSKCRRP